MPKRWDTWKKYMWEKNILPSVGIQVMCRLAGSDKVD